MTPYQFAILRYQHSPSAGELVNIGIVMWLPTEEKIWHRVNERYGRLSDFLSGEFDGARYREMLRRIDRHFASVSVSERQLVLFSERFGDLNDFLSRLLRRDDSCFQWSDVMAGIADTPSARLDELFVEFVTKHEQATRQGRDEEHIWQTVDETLRKAGLANRVRKNVPIQGPLYNYNFRAGWKNGTAQVMEPISFDLVNKGRIVEKANTWNGRLHSLQNDQHFQLIGIVAEPTDPQLRNAFNTALQILKSAPSVRRLIRESEIEEAIGLIEHDIDHAD